MADGSIRIDTKLENKEIEKDLQNMECMFKRTANNIKKAFNGGNTVDGLKKEIKSLEQIIKDNEKQIQSYQKNLDNVDAEKPIIEIQKLINSNEKEIEKGKAKIDEYQKKLDEIDTKKSIIIEETVANNRIGFNDDDKSVDKRVEQSLSSNNDYQKLISQEQSLVAGMNQYHESVRNAESKVKDLNISLQTTREELKSDFSSGIEKCKKTIAETQPQVSKLQDKLAKLKEKLNMSKEADKTKSSLNSVSRSSKSFGDSIANSAERGMKKLIKMGMAIFSVRSAYMFARRAVSAYLDSNEQAANQIKAIWNVVAQTVGPIVNQIISWVATLIGYINAFIKMLTGIDLVAKGNAAALNKQASAAGNVAKQTEKANRQLAAFDEMNVLDDNSSDSSGGGGGGGASIPQLNVDSIDYDGIKDKLLKLMEPVILAWDRYGQGFIDSFKYGLSSIMELVKEIGKSFEEVWTNGTGEATCSFILLILTNIFNTIGNIASGLKDAWAENETGTKIVQALWNAFNNLLEIINLVTGDVEEFTRDIDFSPFLNGILLISQAFERITDASKRIVKNILEEDFEAAGKTAADLFNSGFKAINDIVTSINWLKLGRNIGQYLYDGATSILTTVTTFFSSLDWSLAGKAISNAVDGCLMAAWNTVMTVDWAQLGISIADTIFSALSGVIELLLSIDWLGILGDIGALCVEGLVAGLKTLGTAVVKLFTDMVDAVLDFLGIHSPSTLFIEIGENILLGIQEGLKSLVEWFESLFQKAYDKICSIFQNIGKWFSDRYNDVKNVLLSVPQWFGQKFTEAWTNIKNIFSLSNVKLFFSGILAGIQNTFSNIPNWFKTKFTEAWTAVKNVFSTGGKIFDGIKDGILSGLKNVINAIISGINKVIKIPFDGINSALKKIKSVNILGVKPFGFIGTISVPQIPKLAKGGIVNNPGAGVNMGSYIAGERGAEAVVPLENSDFIKSFAKEIATYLEDMNQPVNIVLQVGDKEFYRWFINLKRKYEFVMNGG